MLSARFARLRLAPLSWMALACVSNTTFAQSADVSVACVKPDFLERLRSAPDSSWITALREFNGSSWSKHRDADLACFTLKARQVCPSKGRFLIWRNRGHDIWVRLDGVGDASALRAQLEAIAPRLRLAFQEVSSDGYAGAKIAVATFSGERCLPEGYALGSSDQGDTTLPVDPLRQVRELEAAAKELEKRGVELEGQRLDAEKREAACSSAASACTSEQERTKADASFTNEREQLAKEACSRSADCDPNTADTQGQEKKKSDASESGGAASKVKGSGGMLPPGAPPWLVDLLRMILTYFGVDQAVEGAALALFLLAPDLVNKAAEASAKLTQDFASDDLDKAFEAARQLYQLYNAVNSLSKGLEEAAKKSGFKSAGAMLQAVGGAIEDLPPSLKKELQGSISGDLAKFAKIANQIGSADLEDFKALASGDAQARALLRDRIEAKIRTEARKAVEAAAYGAIREKLNLPKGVLEAVAKSDRADVAASVKREVVAVAAHAIGVDPKELSRVISSGVPTVASSQRIASQLVVGEIKKKIGEYAGVTDAQSVLSATANPSQSNIRRALERNSPSSLKALDEVLQAARDPKSAAYKAAQSEVEKRLKDTISSNALAALSSNAPIGEVLTHEIQARTGLSRSDLAGQTPASQLAARLTSARVSEDDRKLVQAALAQLKTARQDGLESVLGPLRARLMQQEEGRLRHAIGEAVDAQVTVVSDTLPSWLKDEVWALAANPSEGKLKILEGKVLATLTSSVKRTSPAGVEFALVIGCTPDSGQLVPGEESVLIQRLGASLAKLIPSAQFQTTSLNAFCLSARQAVGTWLKSISVAPLQVSMSGNATPLVSAIAFRSGLSSSPVASTRTLTDLASGRIVAGRSSDNVAEAFEAQARSLCPQTSTATGGNLCQRGKDELSRLISDAASLETSDALHKALFTGNSPDYVEASRAILRPLLRTGGQLEGLEGVLFGRDAAARRSAALGVINGVLATGATATKAASLPLEGRSCSAADGLRLRIASRQICSLEDALSAILAERLKSLSSQVPGLDAKDLVGLFLGKQGLAKRLVLINICPGDIAGCSLQNAVVEIGKRVRSDESLRLAKGSIELDDLGTTGKLDADVRSELRRVTASAVSKACPQASNRDVCSAGKETVCSLSAAPDLLTAAVAACPSAVGTELSTSVGASENLTKVQKYLKLADCARTSAPGGMPKDEAEFDRSARECRERAGI